MVQSILCGIRRCNRLTVLKIILTVLFIIVCIALAIIILLQESKSSGLGAISGAADTYWGKNKGRSMEGKLENGTKVLVILFFIIAILLNIPSITGKSSLENNANTTNVGNKINNDASTGSSLTDSNTTEAPASVTSGQAAE